MGRKIDRDTFYRIKTLINQVIESNPEGIKRKDIVGTINNTLPERTRIGYATYNLIKKSDEYENYLGTRHLYYKNHKKRLQEKNAEQAEIEIPVEETENWFVPDAVEEAVSHEALDEAQDDNFLESLFRKYFLIEQAGEYDTKTIAQQLTCAVIAINVLRNELHKEYTGKNNEQTFGKKVLDHLSVIEDELPTISTLLAKSLHNQEVIIDLLSQSTQGVGQLLAEWKGDIKADVPGTTPAQ